MMQNQSLYKSEVAPFILLFSGLLFLTLGLDFLLHLKDILWVGRYWGYLGTLFIVLSFVYSLRKRNILRIGSARTYLTLHEYLGWFGGLMVLVHGGLHFNGILAWLAVGAMLVTIISGLIGRVLLKRSRRFLAEKKEALEKSGLDAEEAERRIFREAIAVEMMKKWRAVHIPITSIFVVLALLHITAVMSFWKW